MKTITLSRTFSQFTVESIAEGDTSEVGFVYEDQEYDFDGAVSELRDCSELTGYPISALSAASTGLCTDDYVSGEQREETVHVNWIDGRAPTAEELTVLFKAAGLTL